MLKRTILRRYLTALLRSETVPQSCECEIGPLWENCGCAVPVYDSLSSGTTEDSSEGREPVVINVLVQTETMSLSQLAACETRLNALIKVIICGGNGEKRNDDLDKITERILTRLYAAPTIEDENGINYPSPHNLAQGGSGVSINIADDPDYDADTTIREISISLQARECLSAPICDVQPICFNIDDLAAPPKATTTEENNG